ncbi:hypothetical protein GXW82_34555 [Streptacidiphilus sp. 4-A2]|nr:hypothetical protein [Streptacidiphilus sp. 4-A2]
MSLVDDDRFAMPEIGFEATAAATVSTTESDAPTTDTHVDSIDVTADVDGTDTVAPPSPSPPSLPSPRSLSVTSACTRTWCALSPSGA